MDTQIVNVQRLNYIDDIFNDSIAPEIQNANFNPIIKVGFLDGYENIRQKMFVAEETKYMLIFVKNVDFVDTTNKQNKFKRSAYAIIRRKVKYIHFETRNIINDIFDYSFLEPNEISNNISFVYNNEYTTNNIYDIYNIDNNYKSKTRIFTNDNQEIENDLYYYFTIFKNQIQYKLGYYVDDEAIKFFHVIMFISWNYGNIPNEEYVFNELMISKKRTIDEIIKTYYNDKGSRSLISQIKSDEHLQLKKIFVACFLCETLYSFFFN